MWPTMWDLRDPEDPYDAQFDEWDELDGWDDEPVTVGPRWIGSRTVRILIALVVAIAMAAVTAGWYFIGRNEVPERPRETIEVMAPTGLA